MKRTEDAEQDVKRVDVTLTAVLEYQAAMPPPYLALHDVKIVDVTSRLVEVVANIAPP